MKTWEIKIDEGVVEVVEEDFDYSLHKFEVYYKDKLIGTIYPHCIEDMEDIKTALDRGESPIGWEDGLGNTITLP